MHSDMSSSTCGLHLVGAFIYIVFHTVCIQAVKALSRLPRCSGSSAHLLLADALSNKISYTGSNVLLGTLSLQSEFYAPGIEDWG